MLGTIADGAAVGAFLGATAALVLGREESVERWAVWGMVFGGAAGFGFALARSVDS